FSVDKPRNLYIRPACVLLLPWARRLGRRPPILCQAHAGPAATGLPGGPAGGFSGWHPKRRGCYGPPNRGGEGESMQLFGRVLAVALMAVTLTACGPLVFGAGGAVIADK